MPKNFEIIEITTILKKGDFFLMWDLHRPDIVEIAMCLESIEAGAFYCPIKILHGKKIETINKIQCCGYIKFNYNLSLDKRVFYLSRSLSRNVFKLFSFLVTISGGIVEPNITEKTDYIIVNTSIDPLVKVFYGSEKDILDLSEAPRKFFNLSHFSFVS